MARYVVFEPPAGNRDPLPVFLRDGFNLWALIAPPLWLAWHRLWVEALLCFAILLGVNFWMVDGPTGPAFASLSTLIGFYVGLEGPAMRMAGLRRRGFSEAVAIEAADIEEAELRYAEDDDVFADAPPPEPRPAPSLAAPITFRPGPALGLLGYPERN
jgi:hypothetical protein